MLRKGQNKVKRELDLAKFIEQRRRTTLTMLATLPTKHLFFVNRFSKTIMDSDSSDEPDEDTLDRFMGEELQPMMVGSETEKLS